MRLYITTIAALVTAAVLATAAPVPTTRQQVQARSQSMYDSSAFQELYVRSLLDEEEESRQDWYARFPSKDLEAQMRMELRKKREDEKREQARLENERKKKEEERIQRNRQQFAEHDRKEKEKFNDWLVESANKIRAVRKLPLIPTRHQIPTITVTPPSRRSFPAQSRSLLDDDADNLD